MSSNILYHYTSLPAFISIIENREFWFSESSLMKDTSEISYGYEIYKKKREDILFYRTGVKKEFKLTVMDWLEIIDQALEKNDLKIFIGSFSREGDLLSQWRAYCRNGGVAIGIADSTSFQRKIVDGFSGFQECIYDETAIVKSLRAFLKDFVDGLFLVGNQEQPNLPNEFKPLLELIDLFTDIITKSLVKRQGLDVGPDQLKTLRLFQNLLIFSAMKLEYLLPRFKNKCFQEEREVRFSRILDPDDLKKIHHRPVNERIVSYVKMPITIEDIQKVVIAPSPESGNQISIIQGMLKKHGFGNAEVVVSKIPLRL